MEQLIEDSLPMETGSKSEEALIKKELAEKTHSRLRKLPLIYKEPLSPYCLEGKTYDEISDILRILTNTVGTRVSRAKALMKKICQTQNK